MRTSTQTLCGCYYLPSADAYYTRKYFPQVDLKAHTTIISTSSRTVLSQTFINPSSTTNIKECKYVFPLYDGVSVVGFTCQVGSRVIKGIVKEKTKAREEYNSAVERGETAGLLEQGPTSDVFMTSLGNVPAGEQLFVTITFIGELKHDIGADGIRFTNPTRISPRYGQAGMYGDDTTASKGGIAITVDVTMPEDSPLQDVRSPSHPIAVALGSTSNAESQPPHLSRASASLSLGTSTLDKDFVLEIKQLDTGKSKALLETHPKILGQRALMATFVSNAPMQQSKPEIIFVADQSGSMGGERTKTLVAALRVFLKSLPVGINFNICYFGSIHSFLFPKSQAYDQGSLEKALESLNELRGQYGGTETLSAVKASIESRDNEQPLSVILATDGDIWQQQEFFDYLNESVAASKKALRVFALGIGNSVSSALIEGVARAGNGFAQSVGEGEKLDGKVVRMLRGALIPDYGALTMEIQYQKDDDDKDEFVLVERVIDSFDVLGLDDDDWQDAQLGEGEELTFSAETTVVGSGKKCMEKPDTDGQARFSHLPAVPAPKLMQAPQTIPPLYPFSRTNIFVLISPEAAQGTIKSVILKSSRPEKPFELEVPVEILPERAETIHQLAAKKAVNDLEEGRGWLVHAKDEKGVPIKEKHSARFQSMVEREAVRLGIQYQVAGKFTSFVATETVLGVPRNTVLREAGTTKETDRSAPRVLARSPIREDRSVLSRYSLRELAAPIPGVGALFSGSVPSKPAAAGLFGSVSNESAAGGSFEATGGSVRSKPSVAVPYGSFSSTLGGGGLFGGGGSTMSNISTSMSPQQPLYRKVQGQMAPRKQLASKSFMPRGGAATSFSLSSPQAAAMDGEMDTESEETDPLQKIIALQTFEGYWKLDAQLLEVMGLSAEHKPPQDVDAKLWATALAITFLEGKMAGDQEAWVMVVEKARGWLKDNKEGVVAEQWTLAKQLIMETK